MNQKIEHWVRSDSRNSHECKSLCTVPQSRRKLRVRQLGSQLNGASMRARTMARPSLVSPRRYAARPASCHEVTDTFLRLLLMTYLSFFSSHNSRPYTALEIRSLPSDVCAQRYDNVPSCACPRSRTPVLDLDLTPCIRCKHQHRIPYSVSLTRSPGPVQILAARAQRVQHTAFAPRPTALRPSLSLPHPVLVLGAPRPQTDETEQRAYVCTHFISIPPP